MTQLFWAGTQLRADARRLYSFGCREKLAGGLATPLRLATGVDSRVTTSSLSEATAVGSMKTSSVSLGKPSTGNLVMTGLLPSIDPRSPASRGTWIRRFSGSFLDAAIRALTWLTR